MLPHPTTHVSHVISRAKLCAKNIGSVPTKSMCEESLESANLGFEETVKVEAQMPKAGYWGCGYRQQQQRIGKFV